MADLYEAAGRAAVRHRTAGLLLCLALTALSVWLIIARLATGVPVDFRPQSMFMDGGPQIERLHQLEAGYGRQDNDVVVMLRGNLATPQAVAALRQTHAALALLPAAVEVHSLVDATLPILSEHGLEIVRPLDTWPPDQAYARASADSGLAGLVVGRQDPSAEQAALDLTTALRVRIDGDLSRVADLAPAVRAIVTASESIELPPDVVRSVTGIPLIRTQVVDLMMEDELRFLPIVAVLFAAITGLLFRRFWSGLAPLFVTVIGTVWALAVLLGSGTTLNVLSALVPTLTVVIGVSDGVHVVARYREELDPADGSSPTPEDAMGRTLRHMTSACFLTSFTTAAGFLSLLVAQTTVVRDFGLHCAVAVLVVWVAVMLVLPVWLAWIPPQRVGRCLQQDLGVPLLAALDRLTARHSGWVLLGCAAAVSGAAWLGSGLQAQSSILEMYQPSHPTWQAVHQADTRLGGVVPLMVVVSLPDGPTDPPEPLLDPAILGPMATLQAELLARPELGWASSPASVLIQLNDLLTGQAIVPQTRALAAQEMLLAELGGDRRLEALLAPDRASGRILLLARDAGGRALLKIQQETQQRAAVLFAGTKARVDVTGDGFIASAGVQRLVSDLVNSLGVMLVVIVLTLWALLRDLRLALVAAIPNLVPLVFTAATLRLMGVDLQVTNIVSFTVAVGLAVDDTIHFVMRYREERSHGHAVDQAISRTFHGAGRAIIMTSLLLVGGFGVLALSDLTSTRFFGILSAVTMLAALGADLLLLPALLHLIDGRGQRSGPGRSLGRSLGRCPKSPQAAK